MFGKALIVGQNLMAKGAMVLTDAATEGTADTTVETVEEGAKVVENVMDWVQSPNGKFTILCICTLLVCTCNWVLETCWVC